LLLCEDINPVSPKYPEWYGPILVLGHTIQVYRGEMVNSVNPKYPEWYGPILVL